MICQLINANVSYFCPNIYNNVNSNSNLEGPNFGGRYGFKLCDSCDTYSSSQDYSYSYSYDYNYNRYQNNKNYGLAENLNFLAQNEKSPYLFR